MKSECCEEVEQRRGYADMEVGWLVKANTLEMERVIDMFPSKYTKCRIQPST